MPELLYALLNPPVLVYNAVVNWLVLLTPAVRYPVPELITLKIVAVVVIIALITLAGVYFLINKKTPGANPQPATVNTTANSQKSSMPTEEEPVKTATDPKKGDYLTDDKGNTLYTYKKDKKDSSSCNDDCAKTWKPYTEKAKPKTPKSHTPKPKPAPTIKVKPVNIKVKPAKVKINTTKIKRSDGTSQYAYKGHALYHFSGDKKPTDIKGASGHKDWQVATP